MRYFGDDFDFFDSNWNSEYFENGTKNDHYLKSHLLNYELAPTLESNKTNIISKHCVVLLKQYLNINNKEKFYSEGYY